MKLSEYAKRLNLTYKTAFNHFHKGLIIGSYQLENGTIIVPDDYFEKDIEIKKQNTIEEKLDLIISLLQKK